MRPASSVDLPSGVSDLGSGMVSVGVSALADFEIVLPLCIMHFSALKGRGVRKSDWQATQAKLVFCCGRQRKGWGWILEQIITRWGQSTSRASPPELPDFTSRLRDGSLPPQGGAQSLPFWCTVPLPSGHHICGSVPSWSTVPTDGDFDRLACVLRAL